MQTTPPKKKPGLLKEFFRQYLSELCDWDYGLKMGWFLFFPLVAGITLFIIELIRTYIISTSAPPAFFGIMFSCLFKGIVFYFAVVGLVAFGLAVYVVMGMALARFLKWVKSE